MLTTTPHPIHSFLKLTTTKTRGIYLPAQPHPAPLAKLSPT